MSRQLAHYFADKQLQSDCGHCSVCAGKPAILPSAPAPVPLQQYDFYSLSKGICEKLGAGVTPVLISRFFCGLPTPIFTRLKARSLTGFSQFEKYRFAEVKTWVEASLTLMHK